MIGAELSYTAPTITPSPLALMTQEMDPTMKEWLGLGENEELGRRTIRFAMETTHTPLPGAPIVDGISSIVH